jgi:hypothetical protein
MDSHRFDAFTKNIGRRGVIRGGLALFGIALLSTREAAAQTACDRKQKGQPCQRDAACCSRRCNQKTGRCHCSALRKPCFDNFDCCGGTGLSGGVVCSQPSGGSSKIVCCVSITGRCETTADCCSDLECRGRNCKSL